jgi:aspartate/methionine/tyrosine aminotransferase
MSFRTKTIERNVGLKMFNQKKKWSESINAQPMFNVLALANQREKLGNYVARMEIGDTPGFQNNSINKALLKFSQEPHRYSPSKGEPFLIDVLFETQWKQFSRSDYDITIAPANFLIMAALAAVTSRGDTVMIPDPGFPTYQLACDFLGLNTLSYSLYPSDNNNFPEINFVKKNFRDLPTAIIVNNPSNPLGIAYDGNQISNAIQSLTAQGVKLIIDETYINLVYDATQALIPFKDAIRIRTFSKEHCAPGLRIGYVLANHNYSKTIADFISLTISCMPRFIQMAVAEYLSTNDSTLFQQSVIKEMKQRYERLFSMMPVNSMLSQPNSAFYALIETGDCARSFDFFLERNVATCPGTKFGVAASTALRISIAGKAENLNKDFELLQHAYVDWTNRL